MDSKLEQTHLLKRTMQIWINTADTLPSTGITKLPSYTASHMSSVDYVPRDAIKLTERASLHSRKPATALVVAGRALTILDPCEFVRLYSILCSPTQIPVLHCLRGMLVHDPSVERKRSRDIAFPIRVQYMHSLTLT